MCILLGSRLVFFYMCNDVELGPQKEKNQNLLVADKANENKCVLPSAVSDIFSCIQCSDDQQNQLGILFGSTCYNQFLAEQCRYICPN